MEGLAWCHQRHGSVQGGEARAAPPCHGPAMGGAHLVESWDATAVATLPALERWFGAAAVLRHEAMAAGWSSVCAMAERSGGPEQPRCYDSELR